MGAGVKKPVNIFRLKDLNEPKGVLGWRLWFAVFSFSLLGAARGVDEGLIGGAFKAEHFQQSFGYDNYDANTQANIKANVSAMVLIGSVGGALIAFLICDRLGRIWAVRIATILWILGISIFLGSSGSLGAIYVGRFIAGLGIGQTPVLGPIYIAEIAPASIRGLCTCMFTGFAYIGIVLAYFANYGSQSNFPNGSAAQWQIPTSLHIMFAGVIFLLTFLQYESPRYLILRGNPEKATSVMAHLRQLPEDHPYVTEEISNIRRAYQIERDTAVGWLGTLKEMFLVPSNLYRIHIAFGAQFISQWSGAGSITVYAVDIFRILGITGQNEALLVTAVFGIVKLCAAVICALFLVDVIGRKRSLLTGITLQAISMIYVASFLTAVPDLGTDGYTVTPSELGPSRGAIAMIYLCGTAWALGWNSMQYLLTAELFPLGIRAVSTSLSMVLHFANQYGNARAVPVMLLPTETGGITPKGTFWSFAAITVFGGLWVWFFVPETGGRTLESMDRLFALPWYKIGRYGNRDAEIKDADAETNDDKGREQSQVGHVESTTEETTIAKA